MELADVREHDPDPQHASPCSTCITDTQTAELADPHLHLHADTDRPVVPDADRPALAETDRAVLTDRATPRDREAVKDKVRKPGMTSSGSEELCGVHCRLETKELWDKFHELGTEMIITKTGRSVSSELATARCRHGRRPSPRDWGLVVVADCFIG